MPSILIIGYGNASRRDDGVAFHILSHLRACLGLPERPLDEEVDDPAERPAMIVGHQLGPELVELIVKYDIVVFVDAHTEGTGWEPVHWQEITPSLRSGMVSHHLKPGTLLALCDSIYGHSPRGYALSVLGTDFDFGDDLAPETATRAAQAVERLVAFWHEHGV
jgi:hydrogenase maturation protease